MHSSKARHTQGCCPSRKQWQEGGSPGPGPVGWRSAQQQVQELLQLWGHLHCCCCGCCLATPRRGHTHQGRGWCVVEVVEDAWRVFRWLLRGFAQGRQLKQAADAAIRCCPNLLTAPTTRLLGRVITFKNNTIPIMSMLQRYQKRQHPHHILLLQPLQGPTFLVDGEKQRLPQVVADPQSL